MTPFLALTVLTAPAALGYCLIGLMDTKKMIPVTLRLALAYGLGTGLLTLGIFLWGALRIPLTIKAVNYPLATSIAICFLLILKSGKRPFGKGLGHNPPSFHLDPLSLVFLLFVLLQTSYVFWRGFTVPVSTWDVFSTHSFNAKILFYEQSLQYLPHLPHSNYPLHVPLLQAWLALNAGAWDDRLINVIFPLYFLALLIICYHFLRSHTRARWALLGLVFLVSSPFLIRHATIGYREFTLLYYNFTTIILLLFWHRKKENVYLILAALFAGITTFVKLEGSGYLAIHLLLLTAILAHEQSISLSQKFKIFLKFFVPSFGVCLSFHAYQYLIRAGAPSHADLSFNLYTLGIEQTVNYVERLKIVLEKIVQNLFFSGNWNILWLILTVSLLRLNRKNVSFEIKLLCLALILFAAIYIPAYTLTQHYYWIAQTEAALSRCILHVFPIVPALIILINFRS